MTKKTRYSNMHDTITRHIVAIVKNEHVFELISARLLLVISSVYRLASGLCQSGFLRLKRNSSDRAGLVIQLSIVLFALTTLWVSGLSLMPLENTGLVETVVTESSIDKLVAIEPEDDEYKVPKIEPMQLFAVSSDFDNIIFNISLELDIDPALVKAVIHSESAFDQFAVSSRGANGLMQLMPETAERFAVADPFNAEQNIRGGARFLKHLLLTFENDERLAVAAYNAGPGRVLYYGNVPPFVETYTFVYKVLGLRKLYADLYADYKDKSGKSLASLEASIST